MNCLQIGTPPNLPNDKELSHVRSFRIEKSTRSHSPAVRAERSSGLDAALQYRADPAYSDHPRTGWRQRMRDGPLGFATRLVERGEDGLKHLQRPCGNRLLQANIPGRVPPPPLPDSLRWIL